MEIPIGSALDLTVKFGSIALLALYSVFAVVVIRQINLMVRTLTTEHDILLRTMAKVHLGIAVLLLVVAILI